jgi:hypothetical protein
VTKRAMDQFERGGGAVSDDPMPAVVRRWRASRTGPDLQELIAAFGMYNKITPEAWAIWDAEIEEYRSRLRRGELPRSSP